MEEIRKNYYKAPIGILEITTNKKALVGLRLIQENRPTLPLTLLEERIINRIEAYFKGKRKNFDLPLNLKGTPFQKKVWQTLLKIPYGCIITYKDIAQMIGHPNAYRAVGNAIHKNPILIIIPCHRVISSNGKLGGFAYELKIKQELLNLEKTIYQSKS